jgi:hypothetical protein
VALAKLLPAMLPGIDLPRALVRGRYMAAAARMESAGVPIDTETLGALRSNWDKIKGRLVEAVDREYGVYVPTGRAPNPESTLGAEVLRVAADHDVDPYPLFHAVREAWREDRAAGAEFQEALKAARKATGLTVNRISAWEESGKDYSTWPGLDVKARELAAELVASVGPECRSDRLTFSADRWARWLADHGIPWPWLESGALDLCDNTFRMMAKAHPEVAPIRELRHALSQLRLNDLAVGPDGRNRCLLSAFRARTSRNQPSNSHFIFGPSCWLRGLIPPEAGRAVAYVDGEQQEFGIAAALSEDRAMMEAYTSGDPYLTFAKQAAAVPADATRETHPMPSPIEKIA